VRLPQPRLTTPEASEHSLQQRPQWPHGPGPVEMNYNRRNPRPRSLGIEIATTLAPFVPHSLMYFRYTKRPSEFLLPLRYPRS
jgi:hypothetical protein